LTNLRHLDVAGCRMGDEGLAALADCSHLAGLRTLLASNNGPTHVGLGAMANSPHFNRLRHLSLDSSYSPQGAAMMARLRQRYGAAFYR
jgi:hypothetical protein